MAISSILKKFFKTKSEKDVEEILPIVKQINDVHKTLLNLSNDELRARTEELKKKIRNYFADDESEIENLKQQAENDEISIEEKSGL